jgi:hypothetical protein
MFKATLPLTCNYKTSIAAHKLLEKILINKCEKAKTIDNDLPNLPDTVLRIANTEEFHWLLQSELKAIKDGLTFIEDKHSTNHFCKWSYGGYLNAKDQSEGVGIKKFINSGN